MSPVSFRAATTVDADRVAALHAESWRRHYRGAYADAFLDGDVLADRRAVWSRRLAMPGLDSVTMLAEIDREIVGFIHAVLDDDERWGALVDNLHVSHTSQRRGLGSGLILRGAER